jgi:hypothetical protein
MTSAPLTPTLTDADLIASWSQRALAAEARAAQLEAELRMMTGRFALQKVSDDLVGSARQVYDQTGRYGLFAHTIKVISINNMCDERSVRHAAKLLSIPELV